MDPAQRATVEILQELEARPFNGAGGVILPFGASTVVWRPGSVSAGNVFATWAEVVAAVAKLNGSVTIALDVSLAAAIIPAGAWDLRPAGINGPVEIVSGTKTSSGPFITIANAAVTIHGLTGLQDVQIDNRSTSDVITVTAVDQVLFFLRGGAAIFQNVLSGGAAFFKVTGTGLALYMQDFAFVSTLDTGVNMLQLVGAVQLNLFIENSSAFDTGQLLVGVGGSVLCDVPAGAGTGFPAYGTQVGAPTVFPRGMREKGSAAILVGTGKSAVIPAFVAAGTQILVSLKTPVGDAATVKYAALAADRVNGVPGSFQVSALIAAGAGAINGADTSTIDWEVIN